MTGFPAPALGRPQRRSGSIPHLLEHEADDVGLRVVARWLIRPASPVTASFPHEMARRAPRLRFRAATMAARVR
jgi:hypothetical protein